jgi:hypothetical protein
MLCKAYAEGVGSAAPVTGAATLSLLQPAKLAPIAAKTRPKIAARARPVEKKPAPNQYHKSLCLIACPITARPPL